MPSWNTHLEAGKRLADKLELTPKEQKEFLFGCLLPDINNAYINHPHVYRTHEETHYVSKKEPDFDKSDPVQLGYLFHLFTDRNFNRDYDEKIIYSPFKDKSEMELEKLKHNDFWLYGTNFRHVLDIFPQEAAELAEKANQIEPVDVNVDDIIEVVEIIELDEVNDAIRNNQYVFYAKEDLDNLLEDTCEKFFNDLEKT